MSESGPFSTHTVREVREAHRGAVRILGWNCDGRKLASGSTDETVKTWSVDLYNPGREKRDSELQIGRVPNVICWSPNHPDQLATCAADDLIRLWDVRTSKASATVKLKKSDFLFLAWNPGQPEIVAAVHEDNEIFFIDLRKQRVLKTMASKGQVNQIRFSKDGKLFFRTVSSGGIEVFSFPELDLLHCLMGHLGQTSTIDCDAEERVLVSGGYDASISVFELETLTCLRSITELDYPAKVLSLSADASHVAYVTEAVHGVCIDNVITGERSAHLPTQHTVPDLCWNPKRMVLAFTGSSYSDYSRGHASRYGNFCIYAPKKE